MELVLFVALAAVCSLVLYYLVRAAVRDGTLDAHRFLERDAQLARMRTEAQRSRSVSGDPDPQEGPRG